MPPSSDRGGLLAQVLESRTVEVEYQPLVDLQTGEVVGFEALARGPAGPLRSPVELFAEAELAGRTTELDWVCRAAAFDGALAAQLPPGVSLFVNVEVASLTRGCPPDLVETVSRAQSSLRVLVEINDRALAADPSGLLEAVDVARANGWGISVDDVGSSLGCLAVLPLVHADVVKLDARLLDEVDDPSPAVATVLRHLEATGATLVVKGIESSDDLRVATALGARYGQGSHLGGPGPLPADMGLPRTVVPLLGPGRGVPSGASPFEVIAPRGRRTVDRDLLRRLAHLFAVRALSSAARPVVVVGTGSRAPGEIDPGMLADLTGLRERAVVLVVLGPGVPEEPAPGVRGVHLPAGDPALGESFLLILTESMSLALAARRSSGVRGVELVLTQEPHAVGDVAQHVLRRLPAVGDGHVARPLPTPTAAEPVQEPEDEPCEQPGPGQRREGLLGRILARG